MTAKKSGGSNIRLNSGCATWLSPETRHMNLRGLGKPWRPNRQKQVKGFDVDYFFDIPLELAKRIVGFKHDEVAPGHLEVLGFVEMACCRNR
jgi:hypothetical protein